jgi:hypothetical protein
MSARKAFSQETHVYGETEPSQLYPEDRGDILLEDPVTIVREEPKNLVVLWFSLRLDRGVVCIEMMPRGARASCVASRWECGQVGVCWEAFSMERNRFD